MKSMIEMWHVNVNKPQGNSARKYFFFNGKSLSFKDFIYWSYVREITGYVAD